MGCYSIDKLNQSEDEFILKSWPNKFGRTPTEYSPDLPDRYNELYTSGLSFLIEITPLDFLADND